MNLIQKLLMVSVCSLLAGWSHAVESYVAVGQGHATVRETRMIELTKGEQVLTLDHLPSEADLSTLNLSVNRFEVRLLSWERLVPSAAAQPGVPPAIHFTGERETAEPASDKSSMRFASPYDGVKHHPVQCRMVSSAGGRQPVHFSYQVPGFTWKAHYDFGLRGAPGVDDASVSTTFKIQLTIENKTTRSYTNAMVRLVGSDDFLRQSLRQEPGFLLELPGQHMGKVLNNDVLEAQPEYVYKLTKPLTLQAGTILQTPLLKRDRIRADYVYRMSSRLLPDGSLGQRHSFREYLLLENSSQNDLGQLLPAGTATVYDQGIRRTLLRSCRIQPTAVGSPLRVDLGDVDEVKGTRRSLGRKSLKNGRYEEKYEIKITNLKEHSIQVEILEEPSFSLEWKVLRSNSNYEQVGHKLLLKAKVPPRSSHSIYYVLATYLPAF